MKVILLSDVKNVGKKDQIVEVSDGYGRNFLIARKLAVLATDRSLEVLSKQEGARKENDAKLKAEALVIKNNIEAKVFTFKVKTGKDGRVFGSVSTKQIQDELNKQGFKIDKRKIIDSATITSLGFTNVKVELYKDVIATIRVSLISTNG